ncbi:MAG TPA: ATP-binding protein [Dehalococcoidia bacterium]|nr:ATP-binding protein [Dehalococcoidia bacterium]
MSPTFGSDADRLEEGDERAMELHDGVIQTLYGVGLRLESCLDRLEDAESVRREIEDSIEALDSAIARLRAFIAARDPAPRGAPDLPEALLALLHHHSVGAVIQASLSVVGASPPVLDDVQRTRLFLIADEALSNVRDHARARSVSVLLGQEGDKVILRIVDDGVGADWGSVEAGRGLTAMRALAAGMGGDLAVRAAAGGGTEVEVVVPAAGVAGG